MHLSDTTFENLYKDFLAVRAEWSALIRAVTIHNDVTGDGADVRHVGMTNSPGVITRGHELLKRWQLFADLAESKREAGFQACSASLYLPVPVIVDKFIKFSVNHYSATSVKKLRREDILLKLETRLEKARNSLSNPYNIPELERDISIFNSYPPGVYFRVRLSGYNDVFLDFASDEVYDKRVRVGAYGVLLDSRHALQKTGNVQWDINSGEKKYDSVYENLSPIRCSLFTNCEIYLLDDVERAKEKAKKESVERSRQRYAQNRRARLQQQNITPAINSDE